MYAIGNQFLASTFFRNYATHVPVEDRKFFQGVPKNNDPRERV